MSYETKLFRTKPIDCVKDYIKKPQNLLYENSYLFNNAIATYIMC